LAIAHYSFFVFLLTSTVSATNDIITHKITKGKYFFKIFLFFLIIQIVYAECIYTCNT